MSIPLGARFTSVVGCTPQRTVCIQAGIVILLTFKVKVLIQTIARFLITRVRISTKPPQAQDMKSTLVDLKQTFIVGSCRTSKDVIAKSWLFQSNYIESRLWRKIKGIVIVTVDQTLFRDFLHGIDFTFTHPSDCLPFLRQKKTKEHLLSRYRVWSAAKILRQTINSNVKFILFFLLYVKIRHQVSFFGYWAIILFVPRGLEDRNVQVDQVIYQRSFPRKQRFRLQDESSSLCQMQPICQSINPNVDHFTNAQVWICVD